MCVCVSSAVCLCLETLFSITSTTHHLLAPVQSRCQPTSRSRSRGRGGGGRVKRCQLWRRKPGWGDHASSSCFRGCARGPHRLAVHHAHSSREIQFTRGVAIGLRCCWSWPIEVRKQTPRCRRGRRIVRRIIELFSLPRLISLCAISVVLRTVVAVVVAVQRI